MFKYKLEDLKSCINFIQMMIIIYVENNKTFSKNKNFNFRNVTLSNRGGNGPPCPSLCGRYWSLVYIINVNIGRLQYLH